jgi:RNA polymerase sigma-70 factor (ECF subfamily)
MRPPAGALRGPKQRFTLHPFEPRAHYQGMATATMKRPKDLGELVRVHQGGLWRYLRFLGAGEALADDLTQETFLAVWRRPFDQRADEATAAYLRTVARNLFLAAIRKARREPPVADLDAAEAVWERLAGDDGGAAHLDALRECVEGLEGNARQAIDLFYRHGRSRVEVGESLAMTEDGVKSLLRRTRDGLRKCVEGKLNA